MNNSIKDHYNTTDLPWVEEKLHIYIYKSSLTFKEIFRWKKCVKHKFCWLFFFINLKMLMFCGQWGVLPLNRTSKASSGLVISTSTQFITYIQSLESVLRILVWGGLYINHTHIITATSAESRNTKRNMFLPLTLEFRQVTFSTFLNIWQLWCEIFYLKRGLARENWQEYPQNRST